MSGILLHVNQVPVPSTSVNMARRAMSADEFRTFSGVRLFEIAYRNDGLTIKGWLALPEIVTGQLPAIIFNRGGSGPRGALSDVGAMAYAGLYASWGYVGIASNYRGIGGSDGIEEWGHGDVDDAMKLIHVLDSLDYVDTDRLGLVGGSRGGMMALMMLRRTQRFRAAVTFGAPTSLHTEPTKAYIRATMSKHLVHPISEAEVQAEAEKRSAVLWADSLCTTTPLLLQHGTGDRRVPPEHALLLALELQRQNHPYKLVMYDNADHVLAGRRKESTADKRWWLDTYVMNKAPLPKTGPHGA